MYENNTARCECLPGYNGIPCGKYQNGLVGEGKGAAALSIFPDIAEYPVVTDRTNLLGRELSACSVFLNIAECPAVTDRTNLLGRGLSTCSVFPDIAECPAVTNRTNLLGEERGLSTCIVFLDIAEYSMITDGTADSLGRGGELFARGVFPEKSEFPMVSIRLYSFGRVGGCQRQTLFD